ncbi:predicted protein [Chaetomium globosum CBS 148.51]|uniref:Uncharacterized protein n=1 Tax=Chaetomium globosum (strain ATCC 6205 / CBS 148.51 / DSM 1962 / NBRC 6347 / NRRL 1970) TaxID=306901 RepID=Q2HGC8_CHAGB|nr:uncharacterized protein CHGG_00726 [Chaetomium globosum CBS 148.51]EAQ92491.1 predicted protein [Chaetomium globosum CBS 148.51]
MPRAIHFIFPEAKKRASQRPSACVVIQDAHLGARGACGRVAAKSRESIEPVCIGHLCRYKRSNGRRCTRTPLSLAHGDIDPLAGWLPNTEQSPYCERHERHNCIGFLYDAVRCPEAKTEGREYCSAHAATLCKWKANDGSLAIATEEGHECPQPRSRSAIFCKSHRCVWRNGEGKQCPNTSYPNTGGVCAPHTCEKANCGNGALDDLDRCSEHVCAFQRPDQPSDFPVCPGEPIQGQPFCEPHDRYVRLYERVMLDGFLLNRPAVW